MAIELDELAGIDGGEESRRLARYWIDQINSVKDSSEIKRWVKRSETIEKRYRDERNRVDEEGQRRVNTLWANVEILRPALYGKMPLPLAERRFKDKDPTGRAAAQILERALRNEIEICGFDLALQQAVQDYLLPGRGTVWVRYEPEIEEGISLPLDSQTDMRDAQGPIKETQGGETDREPEEPGEGKRPRARLIENDTRGQQVDGEKSGVLPGSEGQPEDDEAAEQKLTDTGDRVVRESTPIDHINWADFFTFPVRARTWTEVSAIGKRVWMSRDQMIKRFGKKIGSAIPLERDDRRSNAQSATLLQVPEDEKGQVFEIWSRDDLTVYWVAVGYDYLCDRKDDPLRLENFFPCPRPLYANATSGTLVPVPDYIQYQDQAIQIDELTQRIAQLAKACKIAGCYNAAATGLKRLFDESVENELIPVEDWAAFAGDKGGVAGNLSLLPVNEIITTLNELMMVKKNCIEEMDRITGISDIMRGTTDARETLGAVRLKSNSTGTRLTWRQNEVARFARDTVRIMADIMSQHFSPQSLIEVSGALYEEGLGPGDMPPLTQLSGPQPGGMPGQAPAPMGGMPPGPPQMPPGAPGQPPMGGPPPPPMGAPPSMPGPPQAPMGQNVVPFRPPGAPPGGPMPPGAPPQPPQPQIPPALQQMQATMQAMQRIANAIKLIRDEKMRGFRVDIEVDSTIFPDAAQEKQDRNQFVQGVTAFLQTSMQMGAMMPESVPLLGKLLQFAVRGHRVGRDLEVAVEEFCDEAVGVIKQRMQEAKQQPNPEMIKLQMEQMATQAEIKGKELDSQTKQQVAQMTMQGKSIDNKQKQDTAQLQISLKQQEAALKQQEMQMELEFKRQELELKRQEMALKQQGMVREQELKQQNMMAQHQMDQQNMVQQNAFQQEQHQQKIEQSREMHAQKMAQPQQQATEGTQSPAVKQ